MKRMTATTAAIAFICSAVFAETHVVPSTRLTASGQTTTAMTRLDTMSTAQLWKCYKTRRASADSLKAKGEFEKSVEAFLIAAHCAEKLNRSDLAAWQLNNAAKHSIDQFKELTSYGNRMGTVERMKPGTKKAEYISECREVFDTHANVLTQAETYLRRARELAKASPHPTRDGYISSNLSYTSFVKDFIEKTL